MTKRESRRLNKAIKTVAKEEQEKNPKISFEEIEAQITKAVEESHAKKEQRRDNIIGGLNKIQVTMDSGGVKGILTKGLMYVVLPFVLITGLGYFIYQGFAKRRVILNFVKGMNNSEIYSDKKTRWKLRVRELVPNVIESKDRENFEAVSKKVKEVYGL